MEVAREIGIGAAVTHRPLPHHRAYGSVHGGSRSYALTQCGFRGMWMKDSDKM